MPVGYVWIVAGVGLLLLILVYSLGYSAGGARAQAARAAELERRLAGEAPIDDPLRRSEGSQPVADDGVAGPPPTSNPPRGQPERGQAPSGGGKGTRAGQPAPGGGAPALGGDPRQPEWYYLVVAHPRVEQAPQLVEFLRGSGLDAHVVRDHNGVARKVIVLPGFATKGERSSPAYTQLWDRLQAAGLKWKGKAKGNSNFGDAYLELYRRPAGG